MRFPLSIQLKGFVSPSRLPIAAATPAPRRRLGAQSNRSPSFRTVYAFFEPGHPTAMKAVNRTLLALLAALGIATQGDAFAQETARAGFIDPKGKDAGSARLTRTPGGVLIELDLSGMPPGEHAFHVHEKGRCDGADGFKSAGDHYAPTRKAHGVKAQGGPHAGDMPNQFVGNDGRLRAHVVNPDVIPGPGNATLFDADGSALVIHAKPDDYRSQPSGDAGDRIACAVVERSAPAR